MSCVCEEKDKTKTGMKKKEQTFGSVTEAPPPLRKSAELRSAAAASVNALLATLDTAVLVVMMKRA